MRTKHFMMLIATLLITMAASPAIASSTFNADGKAIVPGIRSRYASSTNHYHTTIALSNVTSCDVTCKVTLFDQDGSDITSSLFSITKPGGISSDSATTISDVEGEFTLPARSTYNLVFRSLTSSHRVDGFVKIEWKCSDETIQKALMAVSRTFFRTSISEYCDKSVVNGGELF